jgi:hypothetical protein
MIHLGWAGLALSSEFITAWTTFALALFTAIYVWLTYHILREMRSAREPAVFIDIELRNEIEIMLVVGNTGVRPARNITFTINHDLKWLTEGSNLSELPAFREGIPYLAPGRILRFLAGVVDWGNAVKDEAVLDLTLAFDTETEGRVERGVTIDLARYHGLAANTFSLPTDSIAHSLSRLVHLEEMRDINNSNPIGRMFRYSCPFCGRSIPRPAKKCSECGEWLPDERTADSSTVPHSPAEQPAD